MSAPILGRLNVGLIRAALLAALAGILPVGTAHAQLLFGAQYRPSWGAVSFRHKYEHRHGNHYFVQAPTRARQSPFRSGTNTSTAGTISFRHQHGHGSRRFVKAPTRARQSRLHSGVDTGTAGRHGHGNYRLVKAPTRMRQSRLGSGAHTGTAIGAPFKHKHQRGHGNLISLRHKQQHEPAESEVAKKPEPQDPPKGPLQIIISIADQRMSLYDNGALIARSSVSTGVAGHPTPLGIFSVISKERWHRSNIYSAAPMPYMQRITWSGIALHAGVLPGHPASHGCIRLSNEFAIQLWHLTKRGTRVIIARDDVQPVEVANPHLFLRKPKAASGSPDGIVAAAHASLMSDVDKDDLQVSRSIPAALVRGDELAFAKLKAAPQKVVPISFFVSRKLSRLFVRQGVTPLLDVPVEIQNPEKPLGTHVFTAMKSQNDSPSIRWTVVSMPQEFSRTSTGATQERKASGKRTAQTDPPVPLPDNANTAIDRIEIPHDVVEQISELLTPGSSLIISDYGISNETREDTDFIVVAH